jgi:predicted HTH transcriptional regulator
MKRGQEHTLEWVQEVLGNGETHDVEFKESIFGLDASDIVAFANSEKGGTIFLGVREDSDDAGHQRGYVIGCPVGDKEKLKIFNKAESCIPPVDIDVYAEVVYGKRIYRIYIPSGTDKPYCTAGGTYKIRGDARTNPLTPTRLLNLFLEMEGDRFITRFKDATQELTERLDRISHFAKELDHDLDQITARMAKIIEYEKDRYMP